MNDEIEEPTQLFRNRDFETDPLNTQRNWPRFDLLPDFESIILTTTGTSCDLNYRQKQYSPVSMGLV